ncbi:uncharacterized protein BP5553_09945 [Venustampulla echinocandica]|uniref:Uncharacterized protein n=1 Tax=Venustampulla echinocandica TaxID=2656787 RepID=A0A370TB41_9HELO|nr:uncharacterized protein BP5553_09945 [Venustampulla echinocandica]RDL31156.1 hypothetical protein BP5553_09945 [Venustampulla echinocandica]
MSSPTLRKLALATFAGIGAIYTATTFSAPSNTQTIANDMRKQLDEYNSSVEAGKESQFQHAARSDRSTMLDRHELMENAKIRKPWNMTFAEREREATK